MWASERSALARRTQRRQDHQRAVGGENTTCDERRRPQETEMGQLKRKQKLKAETRSKTEAINKEARQGVKTETINFDIKHQKRDKASKLNQTTLI